MSNQVVVPFPGTRLNPSLSDAVAAFGWRRDAQYSRLAARLSTARQMFRAVIETLSYLGEARVRPPLPPALPAARK